MEILNVGLGEMVVIIIIALLVFGPERLPEIARQVGRFFSQIRSTTDEVRRVLVEETAVIREPLEQTKREIESVARPIDQMQKQVKSLGNPLDTINREIKSTITDLKSTATLSKSQSSSQNDSSPSSDSRAQDTSSSSSTLSASVPEPVEGDQSVKKSSAAPSDKAVKSGSK